MTSSGSGKIWILVAEWSRLESSEPNADDVTRKIGPLYFTYIDISNGQKFEPWIKQNQIVILKKFAYLTFEALENDEEVEVFLSVLS